MPDAPDLAVHYIALDAAHPDPRNPKRHDVRLIRDSIEQHGFNDPIGYDVDRDTTVEGHGRIKALKAMRDDGVQPPGNVLTASAVEERGLPTLKDPDPGAWMVPALPLSFDTDQQRDEYLLLHNRAVEAGGWNEEDLAPFLSDAFQAQGTTMPLGWTDAEAANIIAKFDDADTGAGDLDYTYEAEAAGEGGYDWDEDFDPVDAPTTTTQFIQVILEEDDYQEAMQKLDDIKDAERADHDHDKHLNTSEAVLAAIRRAHRALG